MVTGRQEPKKVENHCSTAIVTNAGGFGTYISNKFHFETTQEYTIENADCENPRIKLQNPKNKPNYVAGVAYRHPTSRLDDFIHALNSSTDHIAISNQSFYLLGYFDIITAPNATNSFSDKLIHMLLSNKYHALITIPTRVTNSLSLIIGTSATLCVGSPYVFSVKNYEFVTKNKKRYNFETAKGRNFKFES